MNVSSVTVTVLLQFFPLPSALYNVLVVQDLDKIRLLLAQLVLLKLQLHRNPLEGFLQNRFLGPTLQACLPLR